MRYNSSVSTGGVMAGKSFFSILIFLFSFASNAGMIDSHVHLMSSKNFPQKAMSADRLIQEMDQSKVEKALVLSSAYAVSDQAASLYENDYVSNEISKYPNRLFGFCGVNPMLSWSNTEMKRCRSKGNFIGIKIHTNSSGMDLSDENTLDRLQSVFRQANDFRWTVLIHSGQWSTKDVVSFLSLTYEYPEAKFILGHGLFEGYRNLTLANAFRKEVPDFGKNLFMEISGLVPIYASSPEAESLLWHMRMFGMDHVLFGSDFPIFTFTETFNSLKMLGLTQEEVEKVTVRNFQAFPFLHGM